MNLKAIRKGWNFTTEKTKCNLQVMQKKINGFVTLTYKQISLVQFSLLKQHN